MKKIITSITVILIFVACASAQTPLINDVLDELAFTELQMGAVSIDMHLWFGWFDDDKDGMKGASLKAITDLEGIKKDIQNLNLPENIKSLKGQLLEAVNRLQAVYKDVENIKPEKLKEEFASFNEFYEKYSAEVKSARKQYRPVVNLSESFDSSLEEIKSATNDKDKDIYIKATLLMKGKKYAEAYELLSSLKQKYRNTTFESCILLRMSDCTNMTDSDMKQDADKAEDGLKILSKIVSANKYSPVLFEAFYKWRTTEQEFSHGMSNMSGIPNTEYNKKRWELVQIVKKYLAENSNDIWAQKQKAQLLTLPNIERGGPAGNDNLVHWGLLYADFGEKTEKNN